MITSCQWLKSTGFTIVFVDVCLMTKTVDTQLETTAIFAASNFHGFLTL
jgi:hypothetical protein